MEERLKKFIGKKYSPAERIYLYDYIESYIKEKVQNWDSSPDTDAIAEDFRERIENLAKEDFAFLLITAGYIPEFYRHDSSQETLYSKLIEVMVCEWAKRVGFIDSNIQKQKASKEDVAIQLNNVIIVCDAKSFRLGRSQAAPNVKDTIKKADYDKWKDSYRNKPYKDGVNYSAVGGLITFPTLHRWKGKSDAYLYCTDKDDPICILYYEHLAYYLLTKQDPKNLINTLEKYPDLFPSKSKDQHQYFETILGSLFGEKNDDLIDFIKLSLEVMDEQTIHKLKLIDKEISDLKEKVTAEVNAIPPENIDELKSRLIQSEIKLISEHLHKQQKNIIKFRVIKGATEERVAD